MTKLKEKVSEFKRIELIENVRFMVNRVTYNSYVSIFQKLYSGRWLGNIPGQVGKKFAEIEDGIEKSAKRGRLSAINVDYFLKKQSDLGLKRDHNLKSICIDAVETFTAASKYPRSIKIKTTKKIIFHCRKKELEFLIYLALNAMIDTCPESKLKILLESSDYEVQIAIQSNVNVSEEELKKVKSIEDLDYIECMENKLALLYSKVSGLDGETEIINHESGGLSFMIKLRIDN